MDKKYQLPPPIGQSHPWLMYCHGREFQRQTFFSIWEDRYYTRIIPALRHKGIHRSSNGCLLIKDDSNNFSLLDFVSMEIIQLPPVEFDFRHCIVYRSDGDSSHSCRILFMNKDFLMLWQPGNDEYIKKQIQIEDEEDEDSSLKDIDNEEFDDTDDRKSPEDDNRDEGFQYEDQRDISEGLQYMNDHSEDDDESQDEEDHSEDDDDDDDEFQDEDDRLEGGNFDLLLSSAVVIENRLYDVLLEGYGLVVSDLEDSTVRFRKLTKTPLPRPGPPGTISHSSYLIESHKEILLVRRIYSNSFLSCQEDVDFEVFRFDCSINEWVETQNIGQRSLFLNHRGGRCYDVMESRIKVNSIYFFQFDDRHLYVFDIKDKSISISLPCSIVSNYRSTLHWI